MTKLIYYDDSNPGISRHRKGRGFSYVAPDGQLITCVTERARLAALAVPPAYDDVWISPYENGHLLATGRDTRGRKQYRYHPDWRAQRDAQKFSKLGNLAARLPALRRWITDRLAGPVGTRDTAVAAALALIDRAALRPGNPVYVAENKSYGATTLRARHVDVDGAEILLRFSAKGGKKVRKSLYGKRLARVLHASADLPGPTLFSFLDQQEQPVPVRTDHLNEVLSSICGEDVTPKVLRTWAGTHAAFWVAYSAAGDLTIRDMSEAAAERLDNTPTIARKSYIHPNVIELSELSEKARKDALRSLSDNDPAGLRRGEAALANLLGYD